MKKQSSPLNKTATTIANLTTFAKQDNSQWLKTAALLLASVLILGLSSSFAKAEVLSVEQTQEKIAIGAQGSEFSDINRPKMGMSQSEVLRIYGTPEEQGKAVGNPPISQWRYANYTVYFEYDHVIHSVLKKTAK